MKRPSALGGAALAVCALSFGVACGSDGGRFDGQVAEIRSAVRDQDQTAALQALEDLALAAWAARDEGELSDGELEEVATLVESSRALVRQLTPAPTPPAPTTTAPPTTVEPHPGDERGERKGDKDRDKGDKDKDRDEDDDDD